MILSFFCNLFDKKVFLHVFIVGISYGLLKNGKFVLLAILCCEKIYVLV